MSTPPENDLNLDELFLPAWAQESPAANPYAKYEGRDEPSHGDRRERRDWGDRPRRRPDNRGRGPGPGRGNRQDGQRQRGKKGQGGPRFQDRHEREHEHHAPPPLPELNVTFAPEEKGVESLARQIRMNGRAYPLFDIARMILQKPERHSVTFHVIKKPDGTPAQPLFVCALDNSLWLSQDDAVAHVLSRHFGTFYQTERTPTDPPKGTYTFVAQCGMSGVILGPPNYHDYQIKLHRLHSERFSRMPFETFKSRVKIVRDEGVVKRWIDEQSWKTEYVALNVPEAQRFANRAEVESHFQTTHLANIIKPVEESHTLTGQEARNLRGPLARLQMKAQDDQRRFPLQIATVLSQQFASHGLQFFKVNKTITHVSVARPHFLDIEATPVSENIKRIVAFIDATPHCTRRKLIQGLVPLAAKQAPPPAESAQPAKVETGEPTAAEAPAAAETTAAQQPAAGEDPANKFEESPELTALITDLHWLIHQGHVIEFANSIIETAKKPAPKKKPAENQSEAVAMEPPKDPPAPPTVPTDTEESSSAAANPESVPQTGETVAGAVETGDAIPSESTDPTMHDAPERQPEGPKQSSDAGATSPEESEQKDSSSGGTMAEPEKRDS